MADDVVFLGVPKVLRNVGDVLATAGRLDLPNAVVLSEREDGSLVFLTTEMSVADANWLLDRFKYLLQCADAYERRQLDPENHNGA